MDRSSLPSSCRRLPPLEGYLGSSAINTSTLPCHTHTHTRGRKRRQINTLCLSGNLTHITTHFCDNVDELCSVSVALHHLVVAVLRAGGSRRCMIAWCTTGPSPTSCAATHLLDFGVLAQLVDDLIWPILKCGAVSEVDKGDPPYVCHAPHTPPTHPLHTAVCVCT